MTTTPTVADVLLALCCECGTTRTVSRRASGVGGNRPLRCETCRKTTPHAAIGAARFDWREDLNHEKKPDLSVEDQLDLLRSLGARVYEETEAPRLIAGVGHYLDDDTFEVHFNPAADPVELALHLAKIVEWVTKPDDQRWFVSKDEDGVAYAGAEWSV